MPRDAYVRMDIDTRILYNKRVRALQRSAPTDWPHYLVAYLALLGECWHGKDRYVTLEEAWPAALTCDYGTACSYLRACGLIDRHDRVPLSAWDDWYGPQARRSHQASNAAAMRWHSDSNAISQPASQPDIPPLPPTGGGDGSKRANGTNPRSVAKQDADARRERGRIRELAYQRGDITEAQLAEYKASDTLPPARH